MNIALQSFTPLQVTIRELAVLVAEMVGYTGTFKFDNTRLDGPPPRNLLDLSRLRVLGAGARLNCAHPATLGAAHAYQDFLVHCAAVGQSYPAEKA